MQQAHFAGISAFEGWIVDIESVCQAKDLPPGTTTAGYSIKSSVATEVAQQDAEVQKRLVAPQLGRWKSKYQRPRTALPLPQGSPKSRLQNPGNGACSLTKPTGSAKTRPVAMKQAAAEQPALITVQRTGMKSSSQQHGTMLVKR